MATKKPSKPADTEFNPARQRRMRDPEAKIPRAAILHLTQGLLDKIKAAGQLQCTVKQAGSVLGVHEMHLGKFLRKHQIARDAWELGKLEGQTNLRQQQFNSAARGNVAMLIWLGKQYLGQTDRGSVGDPYTLDESRGLGPDLALLTKEERGILVRLLTKANGLDKPADPDQAARVA